MESYRVCCAERQTRFVCGNDGVCDCAVSKIDRLGRGYPCLNVLFVFNIALNKDILEIINQISVLHRVSLFELLKSVW